ncbi:MAG TPA: Gfo/Idh/MocA family oxidoreductase [Candidatus Saccharimonadales bacterium]
MSRFRLALAGTGGKYGHGIRAHVIPGRRFGFELVAVFDPSEEKLAEARELLGDEAGFKVYDSFKAMVTDPSIDAVVITSPDENHPKQMKTALEAGVPTLCDKPLATTNKGLRIVKRGLELALRRNIPFMSCHPREGSLPYRWVETHLGDMQRRFGALQHVELDFSYHIPEAAWKQARSLLLDHFLHEIDFVLRLLGSQPFEAWRLADGFDRYTVAGKLQKGVTFLFNGSRRLENSTYPETIMLRFNRGTCLVNTKTGLIIYRNHETEELESELGSPIDYSVSFDLIMANFAAAISQGANSQHIGHLWRINEAALRLTTRGHYKSPGMS